VLTGGEEAWESVDVSLHPAPSNLCVCECECVSVEDGVGFRGVPLGGGARESVDKLLAQAHGDINLLFDEAAMVNEPFLDLMTELVAGMRGSEGVCERERESERERGSE